MECNGSSVLFLGTCDPVLVIHLAKTYQGISWIVLVTANVILELALVLLPIHLIWDLQMPLLAKVIVGIAFSFRAPYASSVVAYKDRLRLTRYSIIAVAILRLIYLKHALSSTDYAFKIVPAEVLTQIEMHYSLIAATIPCMRPFLKAFNTGYLSTSAGQIDHLASSRRDSRRQDSYVLQSKTSISATQVPLRSQAANHESFMGQPECECVNADRISMTNKRSEKMIIRKTVEYGVQVQDRCSGLSKAAIVMDEFKSTF